MPHAWHKAPLAMAWFVIRYDLYTRAEKDGLVRGQFCPEKQIGYVKLKSTRPQSLDLELRDSPAGLRGWLIERDQTQCIWPFIICWTTRGWLL